ncbi:MAG: ABC transporter substrate-binding protein [Epulopiscium sp. Nele67-Bin004]|nr:MAG: ABC transporter substrate-binding protein [Epulopiscium sp. Nele67-Bin004]
MKIFTKSIFKIALLSIGAMGLVGCSSGSGQTTTDASSQNSTNSNASSSSSSETPAQATTSQEPLMVYLNDFDEVIIDLFKEATGYDVEVVLGNGAETMSRIAAEKNNPQWDVVWIDSAASVYNLALQGQVITDWEPENASLLTDFAKEMVPDNKAFYPTGIHAAGVLVYRNDIFDESTAPKTFDDLLIADRGYEIGMADPGVAAPAYPLASYFMYEKGIDGGKEWFQTLFSQGMKVYPKNPQIVQALSGGEINVALLQETNAYDMISSGEPISIVWADGGSPGSIRVAAICSETDNLEVAQAFVNFLLDPETQQALVNTGDEGFFEPSVVGANMNDIRLNDGATLGYADILWAAEHEAEIKSWFADMSVQ